MPNVTFVTGSGISPSGFWRESSTVINLKNGANPQILRIYGDSTYYLALSHNGVNGTITTTSGSLVLSTGGTNVYIGASKNLLFETDNVGNIGAAGATRPKDIYISGKYYGDGSALTGITGATGGISNTGSTTIASDSDASGNEDIAFQTSTVVRWLVKGGTGHLVPNVDATYNIGSTSLRPLAIYAGVFSNGSAIASTIYSAQLTVGAKALSSAQSSGETSGVSIIDLATTWNNAGNTPTAIKLNILDTASNANSLLMDLQVGSVSMLSLGKSGSLISKGSISAGSASYFQIWGKSLIYSDADGLLRITNNAGNDFNRLQFGGTTNAYPALKRNGTGLQLRTADDSAFTDWQCQSVFATISMVIGSNYASAGQIRLSNDAQINWRNATNTGDIGGFSVKNDNALYCGNAVAPASSGTRYLIIDTAGKITSSASAPSGT